MKCRFKNSSGFVLEMEFKNPDRLIYMMERSPVSATGRELTFDGPVDKKNLYEMEFINREGWEREEIAYYNQIL